MKNIDDEVLEYLYHNNDGEFKDVSNILKNSSVDRKRLEKAYGDLKGYIETESVYNYRGVRILGNSESTEKKTPILKVRITRKGKEYYENKKHKKSTYAILRRNSLIKIITAAIAVVTFLLAFFYSDIKKTIVPNFKINIRNTTTDTLIFYSRNEFTICKDITSPKLKGKYTIINNERKLMDSTIIIFPKKDIILTGKILNVEEVAKYYKQENCEIIFGIKDSREKYHFSDGIPFSENGFSTFHFIIKIVK